MKRDFWITVICMLLIILWVYAAVSKLLEFVAFGEQLNKQPLPQWSIPILKWALPVIELGVAILIYNTKTRLKGLIASLFLMIAFTLYVIFALGGAFGRIPCSCAGIISQLKWKGHLIFNISFTIISLIGVMLQIKDGRQYTNQQVQIG